MRNSRATAIEALLLLDKNNDEPLDRIVEKALAQDASRRGFDDGRDRQLVMALVYGVVRWRGYLDRLLADLSSHPLDRMKPLTLAALRVGLYQLLFLDRIPASAAISETIEALKQARQPHWLTGFANGLLRTAARNLTTLPPPDRNAAMLSHPAWLLARWRSLFGEERCGRICEINNRLPDLVLRLNRRLITADDFRSLLADRGIACAPGRFASDAVVLEGFRGGVGELPGYAEGWFTVQDEAAQLVSLLLAPFGPGKYLDGCAGLGGKTLHLTELLPKEATLTAVEPSAGRLAKLRDNLLRLTSRAIELYEGTLEQYALACQGGFRAILIDAPCSGLGVIRRQPDIRWNRSEADLTRYQFRQQALLTTAATLLAPGGVLVYATCSIDPVENDTVIDHFLAAHPAFVLSHGREFLPEAAGVFCDPVGFFKTTPEQGLDGFFAARLIKRD